MGNMNATTPVQQIVYYSPKWSVLLIHLPFLYCTKITATFDSLEYSSVFMCTINYVIKMRWITYLIPFCVILIVS